jgi:glycosyltransferase involved in cell wall biosynthesis
MDANRPSICLITIPELTGYSPERLHYAIGAILDEYSDVTLVGPQRTSDRIEKRFELYTPVKRLLPSPIQMIFMIPLSVLLVLQCVRKYDPDVIAAIGNIYANGFACAVVGRFTATQSVVRVTSDLFAIYRYQETAVDRLKMFIQNNVLGRIAVHLADRVITLGPVMKGKLETKGVAGEKVEVVPQPLLFEDRDKPKKKVVRDALDVDPGVRVVLFVGYFSRVKGPNRLLRTINYVRERDSETVFILVGDGGSEEQRLHSELEDCSGVIFTGWVDHEELPAYYDAADVLLHPSNSDGLPNVVLEAQHHDVPVVATDSGGEVPVHVSNIGRSYEDLGEMILNSETLVLDQLHPDVQPRRNRQLYKDVFLRRTGNSRSSGSNSNTSSFDAE